MKKLLAKIRKILKDRRTRQLLTRIISITAAVVVFITTYALVLPAITMESDANCGIPAHQHDDSCYEDRLICGQEESPGHHHSDACYSISKSLICKETEHQHDDSCYDADGNLTCELAEHIHDDSCYEETRELVCDIPESDGHEHTADCYERVLACGMEAHTHSTACYSHTSELAASAPVEFSAVATTELGSAGATISASTEAGMDSDETSAETSNAWSTGDNSAGGMSSSTTDPASTAAIASTTAATTADNSSTAAAASTGNTAFDTAADADTYTPQLEPVIFEQILTKDTGIYYYHAEDGEDIPESSADITDWKLVNDDTELTPTDLLRVYLCYTIPAGTINATNDIARYRLPSNLHLTDQQMEAINTTVNGIANQYVNLDTLEITDTERYNTYLGIEATEGNRKPSDNIDEYFTDHPNLEGQEYINAVVRAENVFDETTEEYLGQDLVFTFTPYTVQKNQHEYDTEGQPTKAGQKVNGWLCFDLHMDQIDWSEPVISTIEDPAAPAQDVAVENTEDTKSSDTAEATEKVASDMDEEASLFSSDPDAVSTNNITEKKESSAEIVFAAKDKALKIDEIRTEIHLVEFNTIEKENEAAQDEPDQSADDSTDNANSEMTDDKGDTADDSNSEGEADKPESSDESAADTENQPESAMEINAETYPAVSFEDTITVQAGTLSTDNESAAQATPAETAITVSVIAEEETFPLGTTMQLGKVEDMDTVASAVEGAVEGQTRGFHAVDISFHNADGEEIEPLKPIKVSMTSDAIKQAVEDSSTAPVVVHVENSTDSHHTDPSDRAGESKDTSTDYSSSEVPETDESASLDATMSAQADENTDNIEEPGHADTTLKSSVATLIETIETSSEENIANNKETPDTLSFDAGFFSVYAIVYTVDFHYEINGKMYDFSIPGGGFVSLEHVVEVLGIATADENSENGAENAENGAENGDDSVEEVPGVDEDGENGEGGAEEGADGETSPSSDSTTYEEAIKLNEVEVGEATKRFVADVESVEFSNPELVWVGKVYETTTVGGLKEANGLEVEYSTDLSEEQIAEINAQTVEAGDWALISVKAFDTEESLTVTMKNGDRFVLKVTDENITNTSNLTVGEAYILYIIGGDGNYFALRDDGQTLWVPNHDLDSLDGHYRWVYSTNQNNAVWTCNGYKVNPYLTSHNWYGSSWGDATIYNPAWTPTSRLIALSDGGFKFEDLNDPNRYLAYYSHNTENDIIRTKRDSGQNDVISIHIYKPGTSYNVQMRSNNENFGSVSYNNQSTSASVPTITAETEKNVAENKQVTGNIQAIPKEGYKFTGWTVQQVNSWDEYEVVNWGQGASDTSAVIRPTVNGNLILQANFEPERLYTFTVRTNNEEMGTVGGGNKDGETVTEQVSFQSVTGAVINDRGRNAYELTAKNKPLHKFVKWELRDSNGVLKQEITNSNITTNTLEITEEDMTLTAVFAKKTETEITEEDIDALLDDWKGEMTDDFVGVDKTAHVHDYENRIYEIDLSASSGKWAVERSINLDFITDTSRSMYFPANLEYASNDNANADINRRNSTFNSLSSWLSSNGIAGEKYYVITNDDSATMYVAYDDDGSWKLMDSSYYYYVKAGTTSHTGVPVPNSREFSYNDSNKSLTGIIYKSSDAPSSYVNHQAPDALNQYWSRLDYLYKAVMTATETLKTIDPNANVHITTFNAASTNVGALGVNEQSVYSGTLKNISPSGGTRQDRGLWTARTGQNRSSSQNPDTNTGVGSSSAFYNSNNRQNFAILITDGAPNGGPGWGNANSGIIQQANLLKAIKDSNNQNLTLMTLGLGLNFVGPDNKTNLAGIATSSAYAEDANNGGEIVRAIKDLIQNMVKKADLFGTVSDTLDPAFYPVKSDGTPITPGYYTMDGSPYTPRQNDTNQYCRWTRNGDVWTVTYYNQSFKWPERDSNNNITTNGWEQTFYVKSKENFLGGNTIETNQGTTFTATHTVLLDDSGNEHPDTKKEIRNVNNQAAPIVKSDVPTPHVNVKQLTMNQHDTKWTVYTETMVHSPIDQIKELFNNIKVSEVVSESTDNMITNKDQMLFEPGTGTEPETFLLKDVINVTAANWNDLAGIGGGDGTVDVPYTLYDHTPGVIRLTLTKTGGNADYSAHETSNVPDDVEEYVLTAQYILYTVEQMQQDDADGGDYHTTKNESAGTVQQDGRPSINTHVIELFTRGISITKTDATFANALPGAEFTVYRPATAAEMASTDPAVQAKLRTFDGDSDTYFADHDLEFDDGGVAFKNAVKAYGSETKYYLVEKTAPEGYALLEDPIPVTLTITDAYTSMPVEEGTTPVTQATKPNSGMFNWTQEAKLEIPGTSDIIIRTTGAYDPEDESTVLTDPPTASSLYEVIYYRIKNEPLTTDITFQKVDENATGLPGAVFQLMILDDEGKNPQTVLTTPGYTGITGLGDVTENGILFKSAIRSDGTEQTIADLPDGKYRLVERVAPAGYIIEKSEWNFEIMNSVIVARDEGMGSGVAIIIANQPGAALPNTGGPGTTAFYIIGFMLIAFAGAGLMMRKRKRDAA